MQILNLTPSINVLDKNYSLNGTILCLCDATISDFTIYLPDAQDVVFKFKKVNSTNKVYLKSLFGLIDNKESEVLENLNECKTLEFDNVNWWVTGSYNETALFS